MSTAVKPDGQRSRNQYAAPTRQQHQQSNGSLSQVKDQSDAGYDCRYQEDGQSKQQSCQRRGAHSLRPIDRSRRRQRQGSRLRPGLQLVRYGLGKCRHDRRFGRRGGHTDLRCATVRAESYAIFHARTATVTGMIHFEFRLQEGPGGAQRRGEQPQIYTDRHRFHPRVVQIRSDPRKSVAFFTAFLSPRGSVRRPARR